jgi:heme A synthase
MEDATAVIAFLLSAVGMIALLAVFVFWGASNSSDALPYFVVPVLLFGLSGVLGYRAARLGQYS